MKKTSQLWIKFIDGGNDLFCMFLTISMINAHYVKSIFSKFEIYKPHLFNWNHRFSDYVRWGSRDQGSLFFNRKQRIKIVQPTGPIKYS